MLGEAALAPLGAERHLDDASKHCPEDISGESHADGEIVGSLSWTLRTDLGQAHGDMLVWNAMQMLMPGADLTAFGQNLIAESQVMQSNGILTAAEAAQVKADVTARGIDDCGPVLSVDGANARTTIVVGLDQLAELAGVGCGDLQQAGIVAQSAFHFSRATSATDTGVHFNVEMDGASDLAYDVLVRKGNHVTFDTSNMGFPVANAFDVDDMGGGSPTTDVVIDGSSNPPFEPGATYYLVVTSTACSSATLTVTADADTNTTTSTTSSTGSSGSTSTGFVATSSVSSGTGGEGGAGPKSGVIYINRGFCGCDLPGRRSVPGAPVVAAAALVFAAARRRARKKPNVRA